MIASEPAPIVVVGASLGGYAALAALAEPSTASRAAGLVLVDAVPSLEPGRAHGWLDGRGLRERHRELVDDLLASGGELLATAAALDMPILLVRAGRQSPLSDADVDRLGTANRRVTVTSVPDSGHLVARDAPVELARIVSPYATAWLGAGADGQLSSFGQANEPDSLGL